MKKVISATMVVFLLLTLVVVAAPARSEFTAPPTFLVGTNNTLTGATNAIYTFTLGNLNNAGDFIRAVRIQAPVGYSGNPLLVSPGALLGTVVVDGSTLEVRGAPGWGNRAVVEWVLGPLRIPVGEIVLDLGNREFTLDVTFNYQATVVNAVLTTISGLFVNPDTPGPYTWRAWAQSRSSHWVALNTSDVAIAAPVLPVMHVASVDLSLSRIWLFTYVRGEVTIVDAANVPVPAARVRVQWSGIGSGTRMSMTDVNGRARLSLFLYNPSGSLTLTVLNVAKPSFVYGPPFNMADTIILP